MPVQLNRLSILQRWVLTFALSLAPLVILVGFAVWTLDQQSREQYRVAQQVLSLKKNNLILRQNFTALERSLRQFLVLNDAELMPLILSRRDSIKQTRQQLLLNVVFDQQSLESLTNLFEKWLNSIEQLVQLARSGQVIEQELTRASQQLSSIDSHIELAIEQKLKSSEQRFRDAELLLLLLAALVLPISIGLIIYSIRTISQPLMALTQAINQLGRGGWQHAIKIDGPIDLMILGQRLEWMRRKLNSGERQKRLFLQHVTHELKTPLSAIMEASSLLSDEIPGALNESQQQVLKILQSNSESLHDMIQQLLSFHTLLTDNSPVYQTIDVDKLVKQSVAEFENYPKRVDWQLKGDALSVRSDPSRLQMILKNLLSNAIHYSGDQVNICVSWFATANGWRLLVKDNGLGMNEAELEQIFEPFFQGTQRRQGAIKGSGIGLAIVKQSVLSLQGDIQVLSEPGVGTEFTLDFPWP